MTPEQFDEAVRMLRSVDSMTYEDGYQWLKGENLQIHVEQIAELLQCEVDPIMRGKFIELVGEADLPRYIPLLVDELSHESREVRCWAYNQLVLSEHESARAQADRYRTTHSDEDLY